jgi:short-subunit dehydrogenase
MDTKVLVTGAGSGIGKELTKLFVADGSEVLAVSLVDAELQDLSAALDAGEHSLKTLQMDLATPDAGDKLFAWCTDNDWMPDTLVNNAGFACFGDAVDLSPERVVEMLTLNVITLTKMSMHFGKVMKQRRYGAILNVGSTAGMVPSTRFASYGGSKSYVNTFSSDFPHFSNSF